MTSPIWASDMIRTAERLAGKDAGRGRPALCDLRRATSTAYYALFHQITRHGSITAVPGATEGDISHVTRWYTHTGVGKAAKWVMLAERPGDPPKEARSSPVRLLRTEGREPLPQQLLLVADSFIELQNARHQADYDNEYDPVRYTTLDHVASADAAVRCTWSMWRARTSTKQARVRIHDAYTRFLNLALVASGGPHSR